MGLKTPADWEAEYLPPIDVHWTLRECMEHVEHKWLGMRAYILRSYGLSRTRNYINPVRGIRSIRICASNCALCMVTKHRWGSPSTFGTGNCIYCPLQMFGGGNACATEWTQFLAGNIRPMLCLIKKVKKIANDQGLTWDGL